MTGAPVERWEAFVRDHHCNILHQALHPDVIFESPVLHTPQRGREVAMAYLTAGVELLGTPAFRYVDRWIGPASAVLEFRTELGGVDVNGVDILSWSTEDMLIRRFKVMLRPLKALQAVHRLMADRLASAAGLSGPA